MEYTIIKNKANLRDVIASNRPSNLSQIAFNLSIYQPMGSWNLMDGIKKQEGTSSILLQALWIIWNPLVISYWRYSPETLNSGQNQRFLSRVTLKFDGWHWKPIGHILYTMSSLVHHFKAMGEFKLELQSGNPQFGSNSAIFLSRVTLKFDGWPWSTKGQLCNATSSFVHSKPCHNQRHVTSRDLSSDIHCVNANLRHLSAVVINSTSLFEK